MRVAALVVLLILLPTSLGHAGAGVDVRIDAAGQKLRIHVDTLDGTADALKPAAKLARALLGHAPSQPGLVPLVEWTQPAIRHRSDFVAALGLVPEEGAWSGVYWVEAGDAIQRPRSVTIGQEAALFLLDANLSALAADEIEVRYHFLGDDGREQVVALPSLQVLDENPVRDTVVIGGLASSRAWPGLPDLLLVSTWNQFAHAREVGFTLRDEAGGLLDDWTSGGCAPATHDAPESEAGCRVLFVVGLEGATVTTWSRDADGHRIEHETRALPRMPTE